MTSEQKEEKDLFDLFTNVFLGPAQWEIGKQILFAISLYFLFRFLWYELRPSVSDQNDYRITSKQIFLESKPFWVPPTLQQSALTNDPNLNSTSSLSLLDRHLTENLAGTLRAEPWVREVDSIKLFYPACVEVKAEFREPIASVVTNSAFKDGIHSRALYQIDADGVLLPTDFITASISSDPKSIHRYLLIEGIHSTPVGTYGQPWGDPVIDEAALLAEFLRNDFKQLGISKIVISEEDEKSEIPSEKRSLQRTWRLETQGGRTIIWGTFPMSDVIRARSGLRSLYETAKDEAFRAEEAKLTRLRNLSKGKSLDSLTEESFPIDLTLDN